VKPDVTPDEFWSLALETGDPLTVEGYGWTHQPGMIVNPPRLIERCRRPGSSLPLKKARLSHRKITKEPAELLLLCNPRLLLSLLVGPRLARELLDSSVDVARQQPSAGIEDRSFAGKAEQLSQRSRYCSWQARAQEKHKDDRSAQIDRLG
jgi:hypothetical protein